MSESCSETNGEETKSNQSGSRILPSTVASLLRLLQQQLQGCNQAVQWQRSSLEDSSSAMRVTMETLRQQDTCLQDMQTQVSSRVPHSGVVLAPPTTHPPTHCRHPWNLPACLGSHMRRKHHIYDLQLFEH